MIDRTTQKNLLCIGIVAVAIIFGIISTLINKWWTFSFDKPKEKGYGDYGVFGYCSGDGKTNQCSIIFFFPEFMRITGALMIVSILILIASEVVLGVYVLKKSDTLVLLLISSILTFIAGGVCLIAVIVFGSNANSLGLKGGFGAAFFLAIFTALCSGGAGVFIFLHYRAIKSDQLCPSAYISSRFEKVIPFMTRGMAVIIAGLILAIIATALNLWWLKETQTYGLFKICYNEYYNCVILPGNSWERAVQAFMVISILLMASSIVVIIVYIFVYSEKQSLILAASLLNFIASEFHLLAVTIVSTAMNARLADTGSPHACFFLTLVACSSAISGGVLLLKARSPLSGVPTPAVAFTNNTVITDDEYANPTVIIPTLSPA